MFYRKSFLVFVLAFAALTLGRSPEAMAQWGWDWGDLPPGFIDGGSTNLVYICSQGQGTNTNTLTLGATSDKFESDGAVSCNFGVDRFGVHRGVVQGTDIQCQYHVEWTGDLVSCVNTNAGAVVTVRSTCDNPNVFGSLSCPTLIFNGSPVNDLLGISSKSECEKVFGKNANTLFTQATIAGQLCATLPTNSGGLKLGGLTKTTTNLCHSDGLDTVDCISPGNVTNKSNSEIINLGDVGECSASPQTWNADCSGNKDNGNGTVCFVNGQADSFSFDPTKLDAATATLNGVPVDTKKGKASCTIKDCNGDGVLDFQCAFPTCSGTATVEPDGNLTMVANFLGGTGGGLTCSTTVATSGQ
jgi:hypothetical protein